MVLGPLKETYPKRNKMNQSGNFPSLSAFVTGTGPARDDHNENARGSKFADAPAPCQVCTKQHDIWKCSKFKGPTYEEKRKIVQNGGLCNKSLVKGHIAKECPKVNFKCQRPGCGGSHHTLMHRPVAGIRRDLNSMNRNTASQNSNSATAAIAEQHSQPSQANAGHVTLLGPVMVMELLWQLLGPEKQECVLKLSLLRLAGRAMRLLRHMPFLIMDQR